MINKSLYSVFKKVTSSFIYIYIYIYTHTHTHKHNVTIYHIIGHGNTKCYLRAKMTCVSITTECFIRKTRLLIQKISFSTSKLREFRLKVNINTTKTKSRKILEQFMFFIIYIPFKDFRNTVS